VRRWAARSRRSAALAQARTSSAITIARRHRGSGPGAARSAAWTARRGAAKGTGRGRGRLGARLSARRATARRPRAWPGAR
jgi:hypothetical protein